mmetsp:Transcript_83691/g.231946  ORF Transcript_83691/g.231946 Transcript_83691/m.231946 type:complete len:315 (+) Transcript_83691:955-1899(+)
MVSQNSGLSTNPCSKSLAVSTPLPLTSNFSKASFSFCKDTSPVVRDLRCMKTVSRCAASRRLLMKTPAMRFKKPTITTSTKIRKMTPTNTHCTSPEKSNGDMSLGPHWMPRSSTRFISIKVSSNDPNMPSTSTNPSGASGTTTLMLPVKRTDTAQVATIVMTKIQVMCWKASLRASAMSRKGRTWRKKRMTRNARSARRKRKARKAPNDDNPSTALNTQVSRTPRPMRNPSDISQPSYHGLIGQPIILMAISMTKAAVKKCSVNSRYLSHAYAAASSGSSAWRALLSACTATLTTFRRIRTENKPRKSQWCETR